MVYILTRDSLKAVASYSRSPIAYLTLPFFIPIDIASMGPSKEFKSLIYRSTKADARNADVFIHWPLTGKIVACEGILQLLRSESHRELPGFNSQVTPVASLTLLRWFDMVVAWDIGLKKGRVR